MTTPPTASQALASALAARGVRHAFGMPGGEVLPLLDAFREVGIEFVLVRDEASAGFMADAAWQLTGAPGVCVSTLGPGATNLVSGVAGALLDRAAVVAITGQISAHLQQIYTHQTLDQAGMLRPLVKHQVTLTAREAWREIPLALRHLDVGRPGPVHINLPADVARAPQHGLLEDHFRTAPTAPTDAALADSAGRLAAARAPVLLVGLSDRSAAAASALRALQPALRAPGLTTYRAKGLLDEGSPWFGGAFGLSPVVDGAQQALLAQADLILAVGLDPVELRPNWLPGWPAETPVLVVDSCAPADLLHGRVDVLAGPIPATLDRLRAALGEPASAWDPGSLEAHRATITAPFDDGPAGPAAAIRALAAGLPADAVVALDGGAHRITASHVWPSVRPGLLLQSNGLSSMGFGLPAALAAAVCRPTSPAVCLTGDMGLWMTLGELGVAQERGLDLVVAYLSDRSLSLIELKQERLHLPSTGVRFANPSVGPLAAAFGGVGVAVQGPEAVTAATRAAIERGGLTLIEITIDPAAYRAQM